MNKIILTALVFFLFGATVWGQNDNILEGYWKSVSDVQGQEGQITGIWKFRLTAQGDIQGVLIAAKGADSTTTYTCQKQEFQGLPILGYPWIKGLKPLGPDQWGNGTIVDIQNPQGNVYGFQVQLEQGGTVLKCRGYLGLSIFGRTQTWLAASPSDVSYYTSLWAHSRPSQS